MIGKLRVSADPTASEHTECIVFTLTQSYLFSI